MTGNKLQSEQAKIAIAQKIKHGIRQICRSMSTPFDQENQMPNR